MQAEVITNIKFGIFSPEQIKKLSVAKLTVPDTYNEDGYPLDGGLIDQRLGVIDPGLVCKTCGGRAKSCPGHFGHLELIRPVIHSEFAKITNMLLQATCQECHRILLNDEQIAALQGGDSKGARVGQRQRGTADNIHTATDQTMIKKMKSVKKCPHCGTVQEKLKFSMPTYFYYGERRLKPDEVKDLLAKINDEDLELLGIDPKTSRPEWLVLRHAARAACGRKAVHNPGDRREERGRPHPQARGHNEDQPEARAEHKRGSAADNHRRPLGTSAVPRDHILQQRDQRAYRRQGTGAEGRSRRLPRGSRARREDSGTTSAERGSTTRREQSSASTRTSDIDEVGVPREIAEKMTVPFYVTEWNLEAAKKLLGKSEYPMVMNIVALDGKRKRILDANKEDMLKEIKPGYILERQLQDGDIALFNRQPSLHRISIMAHRVRVFGGKTFRINYCATSPYNADFDGDEMNLHIPQTLEAQAEAKYLMEVQEQIFSPRNGEVVIANGEDGIIGFNQLTQDGSTIRQARDCPPAEPCRHKGDAKGVKGRAVSGQGHLLDAPSQGLLDSSSSQGREVQDKEAASSSRAW